MLQMLLLLMQECLFFLGYVTGKSEFPQPLSRADEAEHIQRMEQGEETARQQLITHNLRLVSHIARKYQVPGYGQDDLISIGVTLRVSRKRKGDVSLSDPIGTDGEGNDITFMDILGTDQDELEETVIRRVTLEKVHRVLALLPSRERMVLELRYGLADGKMHPQHEIATIHQAFCPGGQPLCKMHRSEQIPIPLKSCQK